MNNITKQRWLVLVLLLLLVTNLATLVYLWLPPKEHSLLPGRQGFDLLVKELKMTDAQQTAYATLRDEHQAAVRPLRERLKHAKDGLFELLKNDTASNAVVEAAAAAPAQIQQQLDMASYQHFKKLRMICTQDQQEVFDKIIQDVIRQMAPIPGGRRPGGPGNRQDGPPPGEGPGNQTDRQPPQDSPQPQ